MAQIGSTYAPVNPQLRSTMQDGRDAVRRNFTAVPVNFSASWLLNDEQAQNFEYFYKQDLGDGVAWFEMPLLLPQGKGVQLVQFDGIYNGPTLVTPPGKTPKLWRYTATMQMYLRPAGAPAPAPTPGGGIPEAPLDGQAYARQMGQWTPISAVAGKDGWTPVLALVADGVRIVQQVVDWAGGTTTKPTVGLYVGPTGLTASLAAAVDIRGPAGGAAPVQAVTATVKTIALTDANTYMRFETAGAKTCDFPALAYPVGVEFHFANRATSGDLTLSAASGVTLLAPKGGLLVLEPGDTVTVKFSSSTSADVFGSTGVAP